MACGRCGAENPQSNIYCSSCGVLLSEEGGKVQEGHAPEVSAKMVRIQVRPSEAIIIFGAVLTILGTFLPVIDEEDTQFLWVNWMGGGAVLSLIGILSLAALVLARNGTSRAWHIAILLMGALALALIFQYLYWVHDMDGSVAAGFWVTMVGALLINVGALTRIIFLR